MLCLISEHYSFFFYLYHKKKKNGALLKHPNFFFCPTIWLQGSDISWSGNLDSNFTSGKESKKIKEEIFLPQGRVHNFHLCMVLMCLGKWKLCTLPWGRNIFYLIFLAICPIFLSYKWNGTVCIYHWSAYLLTYLLTYLMI